jgi:hypothetical protein
MKKLPRLWGEKYVTASGRKVRRYFVSRHNNMGGFGGYFYILDRKTNTVLWEPKAGPMVIYGSAGQYRTFRSKSAAENRLKRTTVRAYQIASVNAKLDRRGAW